MEEIRFINMDIENAETMLSEAIAKGDERAAEEIRSSLIAYKEDLAHYTKEVK